MPKKINITCDFCGKDISETGKMPEFRLHLLAESIPSQSMSTYAVLVRPPIDSDKYFCGLNCLTGWSKYAQHPS